MSNEVLVSGEYGAGWSTWAEEKKAKTIAEYQPIINHIKAGNPVLSGEPRPYIPTDKWESATFDETEAHLHPTFRVLVKQMMDDLGMDYFYTGGADGLRVETVDGPYRIDEYDGFESITTAEDLWT